MRALSPEFPAPPFASNFAKRQSSLGKQTQLGQRAQQLAQTQAAIDRYRSYIRDYKHQVSEARRLGSIHTDKQLSSTQLNDSKLQEESKSIRHYQKPSYGAASHTRLDSAYAPRDKDHRHAGTDKRELAEYFLSDKSQRRIGDEQSSVHAQA